MQIWVDADACPAAIKDILYRAAERRKIRMTLVANKLLRVPSSPFSTTTSPFCACVVTLSGGSMMPMPANNPAAAITCLVRGS